MAQLRIWRTIENLRKEFQQDYWWYIEEMLNEVGIFSEV